MSARTLVLRFFALLTLAVWVGGFTFYSAVVIPELHGAMGSVEAGDITRRVTDPLNAIGAVALGVWWALEAVDRSEVRARVRRTRLGLLAATSAILAFLVLLHRVMDGRLDAGRLNGFYPLHRVYLIASTLQWLANLGLLAVAVVGWGARNDHAVEAPNEGERGSA